ESNPSTLNESDKMDFVLTGSDMVTDLILSGRAMNILDTNGRNVDIHRNSDESQIRCDSRKKTPRR
ncbi:hypothetical protein HAX54_007180, partial [Datura stramonium]|nr:hypothetical protein [Datura stramonium]